ncbi:tRNA dihydrouridine synthase DusB [Mycoplasmatota bacterium WC30]
MKWKIRDLEIDNQVLVAPMAGVTNLAYRLILKEFGAGLIYTEMISDKGLLYENQRTKNMIEIVDYEKPIGLQLFGSEVDSMTKAAMYIDEFSKASIIDINMGCPVNKVTKSGAGSKLMTTPDLAHEIVKEIVKNVKKPVTVKIRMGWDHENINAVDFAKKMESAGASAICIHGRTRKDMYSGKADYGIIKEVKENVKIPVIGNGDIKTPEDAKRMLDYTKCDAVMIGRGLLGNPFLVKQIVDYLKTGEYEKEVSLKTRKKYILKHLNKLVELKGERVAVLEMRSHAAWYIKGLKGSTKIKSEIVSTNSIQELEEIIEKYFSELK